VEYWLGVYPVKFFCPDVSCMKRKACERPVFMQDFVDDEVVRIVCINPNLDAYRRFYDKDWAEKFSMITKPTKLSEPGLDLIMDWKGAAYTAAMPWVLIRFNDNYQILWEKYLEISTFNTTLFSSQRICYGAVYHAYENFLSRCVGIAKNKPNYRAKKADSLAADLNGLIDGAGTTCLKNSDIEFARLVRNSLAHNGGRVTPAIVSRNTTIRIIDDQLNIWPEDTKSLFDMLKNKVLWFAEKANDNPLFQ